MPGTEVLLLLGLDFNKKKSLFDFYVLVFLFLHFPVLFSGLMQSGRWALNGNFVYRT
jgi:hypothetical protein